jgi:hypothetical protein
MPLPGLINRLADVSLGQEIPGMGPEDAVKNTTANLYSCMIAKEYFNTDIVIGPTEVNPIVQEYTTYDYSYYDPSTDSYWDGDNNTDGFQAKIDSTNPTSGVSNTSYFHMALCGRRKSIKWRDTQEAGDPAFSTRGTKDGAIAGTDFGVDEDFTRSQTLLLHGPKKEWIGNVAFNDNHGETLTSFFPNLTTYEEIDNTEGLKKDNIFAAEFFDYAPTNGQASNDAYLVLCDSADDDSVNAIYDELLP